MFDDSNDDFLLGLICGVCAADRDGRERFSFRDLLIYVAVGIVGVGIVVLFMFALTR